MSGRRGGAPRASRTNFSPNIPRRYRQPALQHIGQRLRHHPIAHPDRAVLEGGAVNGHIHQVMQKVEGHIRFHTAMSTTFPQPAPGTAPGPGPLKLPADRLRQALGIREVMLGSAGPVRVASSRDRALVLS